MRTSRTLVGLLLAIGCSSGRAEGGAARGSTAQPARAVERRLVQFEGTCDASGAVPIDAHLFAVADDEDNVLRIYDADHGGSPLFATDVSDELGLPRRKKGQPETDLEAATRLGDTALWLSSHARSKKGKQKAERLRFFSTGVPRPGQPISVIGQAYTGLLSDLLSDARLRRFELHAAAERAPQEQGGLNIEGMTAMPDGQVLLGFRNPVPDGSALLLPLRNPLDPPSGKAARFGPAVSLDLGGLGVRSLSYWRDRYLIAAGHYGDGGDHRLFEWAGPGSAPRERAALPDLNPEAFFTPEDRDEVMLLSDDGTRIIDGQRCKDLDAPARKRFRGVWLRLAARP
jgi:hypothetical protein